MFLVLDVHLPFRDGFVSVVYIYIFFSGSRPCPLNMFPCLSTCVFIYLRRGRLLDRILVDVQVTWAFGSLFVGVAAWSVLSFGYSWRWLALLAAVPPAAVVCCFPFVPESPRWHLSNGRTSEAKAILRQIAKRNGVELGQFSLKLEEVSWSVSQGFACVCGDSWS